MMKENHTRRGPPKEYAARILLPISTNMLAQIESVIGKDEGRTAFIRAAVEREIAFRLKRKRAKLLK